MPVTGATYARAVTYTVIERPDPSSGRGQGLDTCAGRASRQTVGALRERLIANRRRGPEVARTVECARCDIEMVKKPSATRGLYYLVCPRCGARLASSYEEAIEHGAGVRTRRDDDSSPGKRDEWHHLRDRAEAFNQRVEQSDPYRVLGLDVRTSFCAVRARYLELAAAHHPDRGGDPERMRDVITAYERIKASRAT